MLLSAAETADIDVNIDKMIIDELVSYSIDAINCDDKKVMYEDSNGK